MVAANYLISNKSLRIVILFNLINQGRSVLIGYNNQTLIFWKFVKVQRRLYFRVNLPAVIDCTGLNDEYFYLYVAVVQTLTNIVVHSRLEEANQRL